MTPEQKDLVQTSFEKVKPIAHAAATLFYGRLFELDPNLEQLFKGDLDEQGRKLMHMIGLAVKGQRFWSADVRSRRAHRPLFERDECDALKLRS